MPEQTGEIKYEHLRAEQQRVAEQYKRLGEENEQLRLELEDIKRSFSFKLLSRVIWPLGGSLVPGLLRSRIKRAVLRFKSASFVRAANRGDEQLRWKIDADLSRPLVVGKGNIFYLSGWCYHPRKRIKKLSVLVDGTPHPVSNYALAETEVSREDPSRVDPAGYSFTSGFWTALSFEETGARREVNLSLRAVLNDGSALEASLGSLTLLPFEQEEEEQAGDFDLNTASPAEPRVAICMATYNPPLDLFARQIESITGQTQRNWVCIISDDCSDPSIFAEIERIAAQDSRFRVCRNTARLGFYRNFERCLRLAPASADFIALSDQDDYWYADKLAACLAEFQTGVQMVYSDMDISTREGDVLSHTYWTTRRNNYTDLEALLLANTITGASLVFRANLLGELLPFPELGQSMYHDHWIACVALTKGKIGYVDRPLYTYRQHSDNVIGHAVSTPPRFWPEFLAIVRLLRLFLMGTMELGQHLSHAYTVYRAYPLRIALLAGVLRLRMKEASAQKRAILKRFARIEHSLSVLIWQAVKSKIFRRSTMGVELICLRCAISARLFKFYCRLNRQRLAISALPPSIGVSQVKSERLLDASDAVEFIPQKIAPLKLHISQRVERCVNVLLSTVDFQYLFAGYLSVFNLALQLKRDGYRVRLVIVDPCDYDPVQWRRRIASYDGLQDLFAEVLTAYVYDRSTPLKVSPHDAFIATSWWTAHVAHHGAQNLGRERFIYLIQDYESLFYPAGSFYALAEQAYTFPHYAIFSTAMLRDYFRQNGIGVYASCGKSQAEMSPIVIRNAANTFEVSETDLRERKLRRLLFYARPEQSFFARNMFELGTLAIREAISEGHFDAEKWEFHGIGTVDKFKSLSLSGNAELKMLPRQNLREYKRILPTYDLGLSLMLTPHPSLMPLDMAAAALVTVTNTYATKTAEKMAEISPNIIAVSPTIDGIKAGLIKALGEVDDFSKRVAGARLNWPMSWEETFGPDVMAPLRKFIGW